MSSRSAENKSAKSKQFAMGLPGFWEVRIMSFDYFGSPGSHFEDFVDFCDSGTEEIGSGYEKGLSK